MGFLNETHSEILEGVEVVETGIPWTQQLMDPFFKEVRRLLLQPLHHRGLDASVRPNLWSLELC
jgi:hypothetical protein